MSGDGTQQTLTKLQRYQISNQLKILEVLYPDESASYSLQREIFERGYELLYDGWCNVRSVNSLLV